jgi:hypothetical protein
MLARSPFMILEHPISPLGDGKSIFALSLWALRESVQGEGHDFPHPFPLPKGEGEFGGFMFDISRGFRCS